MDSLTLERILKADHKTVKYFAGCFPSDRLPHPSTINYPCALVVNLDTHQYEGSHWVAMFAYSLNRQVYYFDSLCLPIPPIIQSSFISYFPSIVKNIRPYQSPLSSTCAQFCITFIHFLSSGKGFDEYLKILNNSSNPDLFVKNFVNKMIN